jgi:hypothetical protein
MVVQVPQNSQGGSTTNVVVLYSQPGQYAPVQDAAHMGRISSAESAAAYRAALPAAAPAASAPPPAETPQSLLAKMEAEYANIERLTDSAEYDTNIHAYTVEERKQNFKDVAGKNREQVNSVQRESLHPLLQCAHPALLTSFSPRHSPLSSSLPSLSGCAGRCASSAAHAERQG